MPLVVIQPPFGNPAARRHWGDTLDTLVDFTTHSRAAFLSPEQRKQLDEFHPNGTARFWGATGKQDKNMERLGPGEIVLFTGKNHVRGIGEVPPMTRQRSGWGVLAVRHAGAGALSPPAGAWEPGSSRPRSAIVVRVVVRYGFRFGSSRGRDGRVICVSCSPNGGSRGPLKSRVVAPGGGVSPPPGGC